MPSRPTSTLLRLASVAGIVGAAVLLASLQAPALGAGVPQFLNLPFDASNKKIVMQRAWTTVDPATGKFTLNHHAIDYVNGTRDVPSTWKPFDVLAAAAGEACGARTGQGGCFDSGEIMGNRVLIKHKVDGQTYYTFYNHLATIADNIPLNNVRNTVHVDAGDKIGVAGSSNSPGVLHLHFELLDANLKPIDPYGIYGITDQYPDPRGKNGKNAGKKNYFLTDPPQPFGMPVKASPAPPTDAATPTSSPAPASQRVGGASPTPSPSATPPPTHTPSPPPAVATLPPNQPPPSSNGTPAADYIPIAAGVGAVVLVAVVLGIFGLTRRQRHPLPPDRWRP